MKRKQIFLIFLIILFAPVIIYGSGNRETGFIIPENAIFAARIDVEQSLDAEITEKLLDLLFILQNKGYPRQTSTAALDEQLSSIYGFTLKDMKYITVFSLSSDLSEQGSKSGTYITLKEDISEKIMQYIQKKYMPEAIQYGKTKYYILQINENKFFFYSTGNNIFVAYEKSILEKMIGIFHGTGSIRNNQKLYTLIDEYKDNHIYAVGYLPEDMTPLPYPLENATDIGLSLSLDDTASFSIKVKTDNAEKAEELITAVKGNLALTNLALLTQKNKKLYTVFTALIQKIEYKQQGPSAIISVTFSGEDLEKILEITPFLMLMKG